MTSVYRTEPFTPATYAPRQPDEFTLADYAAEIGKTESGAWRRLEKFRKAGAVKRRRIRVDEGPETKKGRREAKRLRRPYFMNLYRWVNKPE